MVQVVGCEAAGQDKAALRVKIHGIVQGVGFRPFVYRLAKENSITGWVRNESDGVQLAIEGKANGLTKFLSQLTRDLPPLARITRMEKEPAAFCGYEEFTIEFSKSLAGRGGSVPPDMAVCSDCLKDMTDPRDRHYHYPFTNCTNCGPRFTIISGLPYDRAKTSMKFFVPCPDCSAEYHNPGDRRFHAQPVACPVCGPQVKILDSQGKPVAESAHWLQFFWDSIEKGKIFAIKSLGGYHLACRTEESTVAALRNRKNRPDKPFALLCRDLDAASKYCRISRQEAKALTSAAAPVVLLPVLKGGPIPANINPGLSSLGLMLPYTPLHHQLMQGPFDVLVMTSANPSGLPMIKDDDEALETLKNTTDYFLTHNRGILQRCDDSVTRIVGNRVQFHRRSRGFAPNSFDLGFTSDTVILGTGAEMKNTFCFIKGREAILSQHLGEIDTVESEGAYLESLGHFQKVFNLKARVVAYDMHPEYRVSSLAKQVPAEKYYGIYHHHAHMVSCLAENSHPGPAIGVILDGTGYGEDGAVWGFEVLSGDYLGFNRELSQRYTPLPGGESAVKWPWRMAVSYLFEAMGMEGLSLGQELFGRIFREEYPLLCRQLQAGFPRIPTSSCGRLFDAAAAMMGICLQSTYEGQAAIELSEILDPADIFRSLNPYSYVIKDKKIDFSPLFPELLADLKSGKEKPVLARRFHDTVAGAVVEAVGLVSANTGLQTVALSGGTWHNPYLTQKVRLLLAREKYRVLVHGKVPPNDGGLSLGQAAAAHWRWKEDVPGHTHDG